MNHETLRSLETTLLSDVEDALDGRRRVALVNFPDISNVGDSAIWLGTQEILRAIGVELSWCGSVRETDVEAILSTDPEAILLNGGGNFGDLWKGQQESRETILMARPPVRVIQLPQSVHFREDANARRNAELWSGIEDGIILWRDQPSMEWARRWLPSTESRMSHDIAYGLGPLAPVSSPTLDAVWLMRDDQESIIGERTDLPRGMKITDWAGSDRADPNLAELRSEAARARAVAQTDYSRIGDIYREMAEIRLVRGVGVLSEGSVVVTDRLHGHVIATLMGKPQVLIDNSYGKVFAVHRRSAAAAKDIWLADDIGEAMSVLGERALSGHGR